MTGPAVVLDLAPPVATLTFDRAEAGNLITDAVLVEVQAGLAAAERAQAVVVLLRGKEGVFCTGADLAGASAGDDPVDPDRLYRLWQRLAFGPFVSVAAVEGRASAGGVGFVAACDIVIAAPEASFALSEMLFGLFPACVHPFLERRIGRQRAAFLTLNTAPIGAARAAEWGLVDQVADPLEPAVTAQLRRLTRLSVPAVRRYKGYLAEQNTAVEAARGPAVAANRELFADPEIRRNIDRYVCEMKFPWEP